MQFTHFRLSLFSGFDGLPDTREIVTVRSTGFTTQAAHPDGSHPQRTGFTFEAFSRQFRLHLTKNERLFAANYFEEILR